MPSVAGLPVAGPAGAAPTGPTPVAGPGGAGAPDGGAPARRVGSVPALRLARRPAGAAALGRRAARDAAAPATGRRLAAGGRRRSRSAGRPAVRRSAGAARPSASAHRRAAARWARPGQVLRGGGQPHPLLEQPGHLTAHLGRVGAVGQVEPQAVRAGRRAAQRRVPDPGDLTYGVEDGVDVEPLGPLLQRGGLVVATQVGGDAGEFRSFGGWLHGWRLRHDGHVRLGGDALRQHRRARVRLPAVRRPARPGSPGRGRIGGPRRGVRSSGRARAARIQAADPARGGGRRGGAGGGRRVAGLRRWGGRLGRRRPEPERPGGAAGRGGRVARRPAGVGPAGGRATGVRQGPVPAGEPAPVPLARRDRHLLADRRADPSEGRRSAPRDGRPG